MGWGYVITASGREAGYGVSAQCDEPDCSAVIDRGLAYVCGGMHDGDEWGCGDYCCGEHLYSTAVGRLCRRCRIAYEIVHDEEDEDHCAVCPHCADLATENNRVLARIIALRQARS